MPIFDDNNFENDDFDHSNPNVSFKVPFSEYNISPKMAAQGNNYIEVFQGGEGGGLVDPAAEMRNQAPDDEALAIRSKSLVTVRKGFSAVFKNNAYNNIVTHVLHPELLSKSLSLPDSFEAASSSCFFRNPQGKKFPGLCWTQLDATILEDGNISVSEV